MCKTIPKENLKYPIKVLHCNNIEDKNYDINKNKKKMLKNI
jgi:hypothetical protein